MSDDITEELPVGEPSRRAFITGYGEMAFAPPVIASFALDGLARGRETHEDHHGRPCYPNQSHANQTGANQ